SKGRPWSHDCLTARLPQMLSPAGMQHTGDVVSEFIDIDHSADPDRLVSFLDTVAVVMAPTKSTLLDMLDIRPGQRILDLGCGAGHDLVSIAEAGGFAVGVDPSMHMLKSCMLRCPSARLIRADGTALPLADGTLDGCRIERVLVHLTDPGAVLAEVRRVLRAGGRIVLFEPSTATLRIDGQSAVLDAALRQGIGARYRQPRAGQRAGKWLRDNGFSRVRTRNDVRWFHHVDRLTESMNLAAIWQHAVDAGVITPVDVSAWRADMARRSNESTFGASVRGTFATGVA
ncbi:MAG: methyltransferase domain-containing protein, partial [Mycobacterium sp.]